MEHGEDDERRPKRRKVKEVEVGRTETDKQKTNNYNHTNNNNDAQPPPPQLQLPTAQQEPLSNIVLNEMYQFVGLLDLDGNLLLANRPALTGGGIEATEILNRPFWDAHWWTITKETQEKLKASIAEAALGNFVRYEVEVWGSKLGKEAIWIDFSLKPVRNDLNQIKHILAEGRNITEKKRAEEELKKKSKALEELSNRIQELDQLKSVFFANVSHELRTPLTLISGPAERLLTESSAANPLTPHQRRDIEVIRSNSHLLLKYVNDLLDVAKLEAHNMELQYSIINFGELIRATASNFVVLAEDKNIRLDVECGVESLVSIDEAKFQRIILNLLSNAFKFTPNGGVISIKAGVMPNDPKHICLSVSDSGPGIEEHLHSIIFERFKQIQSSTKQTGTGLGLSIVKEFVDLHQGTITVGRSNEGGAQFDIVFPRYPQGSTSPKHQERFSVAERSSNDAVPLTLCELKYGLQYTSASAPQLVVQPKSEGKETYDLLLVEDNTDMRNFIVRCLPDFRITTACNGKEAIEKALKNKPDVILTDAMMPVMTGDEMLLYIRKHCSELDGVPVIVLTAKADNDFKVKLFKDGAQDFIHKPFSIDELRVRLLRMASIKRARDVLQQQLDSTNTNLVELSSELSASQRKLKELYESTKQAREEAEKMNVLKDKFLFTLSHELRTPLTGILGWTQILKSDLHSGLNDPFELEKTCDLILESAETEKKIVDDLLDFSRISTGMLSFRKEKVNLSSVGKEAISALSLAAKTKQIEVKENIASDLLVLGDSSRLQQMLYNVVSNAIKFTPCGGFVWVSSSCTEDSVCIIVRDTGIGIEPSATNTIFQLFGMVDGSSRRENSGVGIGLAIAKQVAQLHGGTISAESPGLGKGSTFSITLPLHVNQKPSLSPTLTSSVIPQRLHGITVVVVEDDRITSSLISKLLRNEGANPACFNSVRDALQTIDSSHLSPDVVLSDISMPGADGFDLLSGLRKRDYRRPIIAVTAHTSDNDKTKILGAGFNAHVPKPISSSLLYSTILKSLATRSEVA